MGRLKISIIFLFIFLLTLNFISIARSGVYLRYDRNEYYETCTVAYNMENMINTTHLYDFSLNEYHGEKDVGLSSVSGYYGEALNSWTSNTNVTIPDINILNEDYTFMAWIYPYNLGTAQMIFNSPNSEAGNFIYLWTTNVIRFRGGLDNLYSTTLIPQNQWTHFACVRDTSNSTYLARIYINGTLDTGQVTVWRHRNWDAEIFIGENAISFSGRIDEVRIYKGEARTQMEIQQDMATSMAMKLTVEDLEPNEDIVQLWYENDTLFEQKTANVNGIVEFNVFLFSNKTSEYQGVINVYHEDTQYYGYVSVLNWGDVYLFLMLSVYEDLFIQLFYGEGAWLGILIMILGSFFGLVLYKYSAIIFSTIFILLGLQYFTEFSSGSNDLLWFWVFCWIMPIFLIFAMFKIKRRY